MSPVEQHREYWICGFEEDWEVAEILLSENKIRHSLFFAHLALEKLLKALVCMKTGSPAPPVHNLIRLAQLSGIKLSDEHFNLLADMNQFNIEGRYPVCASFNVTVSESEEYFKRSLDVISWLKTLLS